MLVKSPVASYDVEHTVAARQRIELTIAKLFIKEALNAGYQIDVYDGEETTLERSTDIKQIVAAMFTTDEDSLYIWKDGSHIGHVDFIYGNDGYDVISDYTTNLEPLMTTANAWVEKHCTY